MRKTNTLYLKRKTHRDSIRDTYRETHTEKHRHTQRDRHKETHQPTEKFTRGNKYKELLQKSSLPFTTHKDLSILLFQKYLNKVPTHFILIKISKSKNLNPFNYATSFILFHSNHFI